MQDYQAIEVLLIEDNPEDAELIMRSLRKNNLGNKIIHLQDGEEALDFIFAKGKYSDRRIEEKPKVILLDLKMPKVGGFEVLREIKADERTKNIPIVIMTSSKEERDIIEGYKMGINSYVVKPLDFEGFSKAISNLGIYWLLINQPVR